ncbi:dihydrofolate reductase family protein [Steroidobacter flavus]|uniref:Dihydrofolate reductase family protein n=1 Tax=Steroidobacter flavus TaxID=1842136 RepID=A0ABV8SXW4_9GAMM
MRELILKMSITVDGFVASADGGAQWVFDTRDEKAVAWGVKHAWDAGLLIMGSRSFKVMAAYWPTSTDAYAAPMNQISKAVFSKQGTSILPKTNDSWGQAYVATGDLKEEITKFKAQDGKPIIATGGASFARSLVASGLVDQYVLMVHPVVIGKGLPLFADLPAPQILKLVSSTTFPRGGVAQIYRP